MSEITAINVHVDSNGVSVSFYFRWNYGKRRTLIELNAEQIRTLTDAMFVVNSKKALDRQVALVQKEA